MFSFIIFNLFYYSIAATKVFNLYLISNSQNYFDQKYHTFSKSSSNEILFGYNEQKVCLIEKQEKGWMVNTKNFASLETASINIVNHFKDSHYLKPEICFEHTDYTFLIFKRIHTTEINILRGQRLKVTNNMTFDYLRYDHQTGRLFLIEKDLINEVDLNSLNNWWTDPFNNDQVELKINYISRLPQNTKDLMIFDNTIFYIKGGKVFETGLGGGVIDIITEINAEKFNFVLYKPKTNYSIGTMSRFWLYFLYIFDLLLILVVVFVLKHYRLFKQRKRTNSKEMSVYNHDIPQVMESFITKYDFDDDDKKSPY